MRKKTKIKKIVNEMISNNINNNNNTNDINGRNQILSEDYYKVFLIDGSEYQMTSLENRFSQCVSTVGYSSYDYIRIYSCWERALEYIYRAPVKNWGDNLISDLLKAKSELQTILNIVSEEMEHIFQHKTLNICDKKEYNTLMKEFKEQSIFSDYLVPEFLFCNYSNLPQYETIKNLYTNLNSKYFHKYIKSVLPCKSFLCPYALPFCIDLKKRREYLQTKYSFKFDNNVNTYMDSIFIDFLNIRNCNNIERFLKKLTKTIQKIEKIQREK